MKIKSITPKARWSNRIGAGKLAIYIGEKAKYENLIVLITSESHSGEYVSGTVINGCQEYEPGDTIASWGKKYFQKFEGTIEMEQ